MAEPKLDPRRVLVVAYAGRQFGFVSDLEVIDSAVQLLVDGEADLQVACLAGVPAGHASWEVRPRLIAALTSLRVSVPAQDGPEEAVLAAEALCDRYRAGTLSRRDVTSMIHGSGGHLGDWPLDDLALLDDDYDMVGEGYIDRPIAALDSQFDQLMDAIGEAAAITIARLSQA